MDISSTLEPKSDQLDAVDLLGGPRTFTIERASRGDAEQPVQIHLAEFPRPWRPGKSMRRVLVAAWGPDASAYAGRQVTLYCDLEVKFAGERVGGTRISHMSHLPGGKRLDVPLLITRGKSAIFSVQPLVEPTARAVKPGIPTPEQIVTSDDIDALKSWWRAHPARRAEIEARVAELTAEPAPVDQPEEDWPEVAAPADQAGDPPLDPAEA